MHISEILKTRDKGFSFEFFPYRTPKGKEQLAAAVKTLEKHAPLYMSMTYGAGGSSQDRTREAVYLLMEEKDFTIMPHLTCIGANKSSIEALLNEYKARGIENIMALRGDPPRHDPSFDINRGEFRYSGDLMEFIRDRGGFCLGGAVYPETHLESSSLERELEITRSKQDSGAGFLVTQMFFDNRFYYEFLAGCRKAGVTVPILPGVMPVTDLNKLKQFTADCRVSIPLDLEKKMAPYLNQPQEMEKIGLEYTIKQCRDLRKNGVQVLHFFTLNRGDVVAGIIDAL
jgi:methylenetetrahydrofolate reductase (NADPH)